LGDVAYLDRSLFFFFCLPFSILTKRQPTPYTQIYRDTFFLLREASVIKQKGEKKMTTILSFSLVFASYGKSQRITNCVGCRQHIHRERKKKRTGTRNLTRRIKKKERER